MLGDSMNLPPETVKPQMIDDDDSVAIDDDMDPYEDETKILLITMMFPYVNNPSTTSSFMLKYACRNGSLIIVPRS